MVLVMSKIGWYTVNALKRYDPVYAGVHRGCKRRADHCDEWQKVIKNTPK